MLRLRGGEYDVVLLTGRLQNDTRRGGVVFTSGFDDTPSELSLGLDASHLSKLVWEPNRPLRPIVIIDAQIGGGESERMRALFLRNVFCGELAAHETAAAVIGIGLESEHSTTRSAVQLLQMLRDGSCVADAVASVQATETGLLTGDPARWDAELLQRLIPTRGIALWAGAPRHAFVPSPS